MSRAAELLGSSWAAANSMSSGLMSPPYLAVEFTETGYLVELVDLEGQDVALRRLCR